MNRREHNICNKTSRKTKENSEKKQEAFNQRHNEELEMINYSDREEAIPIIFPEKVIYFMLRSF